MAWKGNVRSIHTAMNQAQRESQRRQREVERQQAHLAKLAELDRAAAEVEIFDDYVRGLETIHGIEVAEVDWEAIAVSEPPIEPNHGHSRGAPDGSHSGSDSSSHECDCCDSASDFPALQAVLDSPQSRLKLSVAAAPLVMAAVETVPPAATTAQLRCLQPPALPYERTRRPLLI